MKIVRPVVSFTCLLLGATALQATPISPGQSLIVPEQLPTIVEEVTILDETEGGFSINFGGGGFLGGNYEHGVLVDPFGITCAGCLDFFYRVDLSSASNASLFNVGGGGFEGFETRIGWVLGGDEEDQLMARSPMFGSRSADGSSVVFSFAQQNNEDLSHLVFPGGNTAYLVIATNATSYDRTGTLGIIGGNARNGLGFGLIEGMFAPTGQPTAVPEPGSLALLGAGIAGLFMARRRKTVKLAA